MSDCFSKRRESLSVFPCTKYRGHTSRDQYRSARSSLHLSVARLGLPFGVVLWLRGTDGQTDWLAKRGI